VADTDAASFSFVHAADLHLDTPFHGVGEVAPYVAATLREASLRAFDAIIDLTIERDAAFLVVAGDVYDGAQRGLRAQLRFRDGLARLSRADISSFVVHGNHDPVTTGWSAIGSSWPELVTIFGSSRVETVPVVRGGQQIATIQGISYATAETTDNLALGFSRPDGPGLAVGVLHCNVDGVAGGYAAYSPCTLEDLRRTGLDYLALGHIHERKVIAPGPGEHQWVVYPGNSQARSPRRSEQAPKGAVVVHVERGAVRDVEFVACDLVRFDELTCDIAGIRDLGELEDLLFSHANELLRSSGGRSLVLRARLQGRGTLHDDLSRPGSMLGLLQSLRDTTPNQEPFIWWDAVSDETAGELDLTAIRGRGDFVADLLEVGDELIENNAALGELSEGLAREAPRLLAARISSLLADPAALDDLARRATLLAVDALSMETR
jgi:exonuclease SbcD